MITRSQSGIVKPIDRLSLHTYSISHIPKNLSHVLKDPKWCNAIYDEYNALVKNGTWLLVPRPVGVNMVRSMWFFKHKFYADGTLSCYKARLVANGSSQQQGGDFDEMFSPVVKPAIVRTVLSLVVSRKWPIHQLDVKNAFLNGDLSETVSLYGLKQAPCAWFQRIACYATLAGFYHSRCDSSLFIYRQGSQVAYLLIYVDDIILTASCPAVLQQIIGSLNNEFDMTGLGALNYFLGISADRTPTGLFLSHKKYALQLLERAHMVTCNPSRTPIDTESKLGLEVQQVCLYMHDPREPHFVALKRIMRYVWGNVDFGLQLYKFHADGTLSCYKARLVANGSSQQLGVDFDEMFSPGSQVAYLLIYVDGIILTTSCPAILQQIIGSLNKEFDMTELGALNYFLGISADRTPIGLFLSQKKYALQLLERAHMVTCNPSRTPIDTESKLGPEGVHVQDPTLYRSLAGEEPHFAALKCIMRYVRGNVDFGLQLYVFATTSLAGYTDADWAGCTSTHKSTSGYCVFLGDNILSWSSKQQHIISRSSAEVEYRGVANVFSETAWIRNLLRELHSPLSTATLVYCDNVSAVYMSVNPVQHQRTKHIEIDIHFVRDMVTAGHVRVLHVPSCFQYADIFTKGLLTALFEDFRSSLSVCPPPAQTAGAY
ncbi:ribonuclease H-like domain-containing protein [Tanacetum coccineum]